MDRKVVVVGLEKILWRGDGLLRRTYKHMVEAAMIDDNPEVASRDTRGLLRAIGRGVKGKSVVEMSPIARAAGIDSLSQMDMEFVDRLKDFPEDNYHIVAMSSAPDFVVRSALRRVRDETDVPFSQTNVLASSYPIEAGNYTGQHKPLNKQQAVRSLVTKFGLEKIEVGFINGISDIEWAEAYCANIEPINPGPGLYSHLSAYSPESSQVS